MNIYHLILSYLVRRSIITELPILLLKFNICINYCNLGPGTRIPAFCKDETKKRGEDGQIIRLSVAVFQVGEAPCVLYKTQVNPIQFSVI